MSGLPAASAFWLASERAPSCVRATSMSSGVPLRERPDSLQRSSRAERQRQRDQGGSEGRRGSRRGVHAAGRSLVARLALAGRSAALRRLLGLKVHKRGALQLASDLVHHQPAKARSMSKHATLELGMLLRSTGHALPAALASTACLISKHIGSNCYMWATQAAACKEQG